MADSLNGEPGVDFGKTADAFDDMARGIKARQKGLATGKPQGQAPEPVAPEEIWVTRYGYRAISAGESGVRKMTLEAHAPVSYRPTPLPDLSGLKPIIPQMDPVVFKPQMAVREMVSAPQLVPQTAPAVPPVTPSQAVFMPAPEAPKRSLLARLFGRG